MNRDERSSSNDPTAEPAARQSAQSASGLSPGREKRPARNAEEDAVNRSHANTTPRRYEQPLEEDDQVMPADDSALNTKI